jgi:hypothetical protein
MPSSSKKQHNFMEAIAHNSAFAKKVGIPQSVGQDFARADKGHKFSKGGDTMASKMNPGFMAMMAKKKDGMHKMPDGKMMKDSAMKRGGSVKKMAGGGLAAGHKSANGIASKGKTKGAMIAMKKGGKC